MFDDVTFEIKNGDPEDSFVLPPVDVLKMRILAEKRGQTLNECIYDCIKSYTKFNEDFGEIAYHKPFDGLNDVMTEGGGDYINPEDPVTFEENVKSPESLGSKLTDKVMIDNLCVDMQSVLERLDNTDKQLANINESILEIV